MMTYFSMYAFRKPFAAATYSDISGWSFLLDYKTVLILSQLIGYAASKFIGIKVVSELDPARRTSALFLMIILAECALLLFAIVPAPWNTAALFFNGLPLGMVWGIVFGYLEGRRVSEALGVILSISLIFASGAVKSVGRYLLIEWQIPELWVPFTTGLLFFPLLAISAWCLSCTPPPDQKDIAQRQQRVPMHASQRHAFFKDYAPGLVLLVLSYIILTGFREFIDNFAAELWISLGYAQSAAVYTTSTLPVIAVVLALLLCIMFVKNNMLALSLNHTMVLSGFFVLLVSSFCFQQQLISGSLWMILIQMGVYLGYIPFNCLLFDRLVAATPRLANAGFLIYVADASGYLGTVSIMFYKTFAQPHLNWVEFVISTSYWAGACGLLFSVLSLFYFVVKLGGFSNSGSEGVRDGFTV